MLRVWLFYLFLDVRFIWSDGLHSKLSEAVLRVVPDAGQTGHRGLHRTVAIVADDHAVIDRLQLVYVAALNDLLQAVAQLRFVVYAPPPGDIHVVRLRVLRPKDERRHEFEDERLTIFETRVVQSLQVNDLRVFQRGRPVAVVPFASELEAVKHVLTEGQNVRVIGVQVGVDVPARGLLLFPSVVGPAHDRLVSQRRHPALGPDVVDVQSVAGSGIEQPRMVGVPEEQQVVVALHVGERRPHVRANPALGVFLGERPELTGHKYPESLFSQTE